MELPGCPWVGEAGKGLALRRDRDLAAQLSHGGAQNIELREREGCFPRLALPTSVVPVLTTPRLVSPSSPDPTRTVAPLRTPSWLGFKHARVSVSQAVFFWASQHHCTHTSSSPSYPVSSVIPAPPWLTQTHGTTWTRTLLPVHWQMRPHDKDIRNPMQQATSLNSFLHPTGRLPRPSWRKKTGC